MDKHNSTLFSKKHPFYQKYGQICPAGNVPLINAGYLSKEEFVDRFEKQSQPAMFYNLTDHWKANQKWTFEVRFY